MYLKLENNQVKFRITSKEFDNLIKERVIKGATMDVSYCVSLDDKLSSVTLECSNNNFTLTIPLHVALDHKNILPNKNGIVSKIKTSDNEILKVSLEVDICK